MFFYFTKQGLGGHRNTMDAEESSYIDNCHGCTPKVTVGRQQTPDFILTIAV